VALRIIPQPIERKTTPKAAWITLSGTIVDVNLTYYTMGTQLCYANANAVPVIVLRIACISS